MSTIESAKALQKNGDAFFAEERWKEAQEAYSAAIDHVDALSAEPSLLARILCDRSMTFEMLRDETRALDDAARAVAVCPEWICGYQRHARLLVRQNRLDEASDVIAQGHTVDPKDPVLDEISTHIADIRQDEDASPEDEQLLLRDALTEIRSAGVERPLEVVVLSGFLGAGKTTLLTRLLCENVDGQRIAVLVNDMAEINIDAQLLQQRHSFSEVQEELVELTNGCVCCTLRGDLIKAATKMLCMKCYDVLIIEATGISEPMPVAATFAAEDMDGNSLKEYFKIDNMVTLVDGSQFSEEVAKSHLLKDRKMAAYEDDSRSIAELLIDQVEFADTLIINKCDLISEEDLKKLQKLLKSLNPTAKQLSSVKAQIDTCEILHTGRFCLDEAATFEGFSTELIMPHPSETEEYGVGSFVFSSPLPFHPERLYRLMFEEGQDEDEDEDEAEVDMQISENSALRNVFRSKGFFYLATFLDAKLNWSTAGRTIHFEMADSWLSSMNPQKDSSQTDASWHPVFGDRMQQLVIIGESHYFPRVRSALEQCLLTPSELEQDPSTWHQMDPKDIWNLLVEEDDDDEEDEEDEDEVMDL